MSYSTWLIFLKSNMSIDALTTFSKDWLSAAQAGMYGRDPQIKSPARQFLSKNQFSLLNSCHLEVTFLIPNWN